MATPHTHNHHLFSPTDALPSKFATLDFSTLSSLHNRAERLQKRSPISATVAYQQLLLAIEASLATCESSEDFWSLMNIKRKVVCKLTEISPFSNFDAMIVTKFCRLPSTFAGLSRERVDGLLDHCLPHLELHRTLDYSDRTAGYAIPPFLSPSPPLTHERVILPLQCSVCISS